MTFVDSARMSELFDRLRLLLGDAKNCKIGKDLAYW